jgi:tetratricopeptide (TPR) repeat protein
LRLALEEIAIDSEFRRKDSEDEARRLRYLEVTFERYRDRGNVAEAFANDWAKWERFEEASAWYERARQARDGTASLVAIEQLANARSRQAWNAIKNDPAPTNERLDWARAEIDAAMKLLNTLQALAPTDERASLYGSSYKRLAMLEAKAGRSDAEKKAIEHMLERYTEAETIARDKKGTIFYPAMNRIAAQLALSMPLDPDYVTEVRQSLKSAEPDFWSVVGQTELDLIEAVAAGALSKTVKDLVDEFKAHYERVENPRWWGSVLDNATFLLSCAAAQAEFVAAQQLLDLLAQQARRPAAAVPAPPDTAKSEPKPRARGGSRGKKEP